MARRSDERDAARAEYIARMEKDGEVNLRQLADDLHLKYDTVRRWKAKDGWDPPAPRKPGGQPGNKNAVGNPGGGAPVGNENAMKDGAYATIFFDKLTPEEKQIVENPRKWDLSDDDMDFYYWGIVNLICETPNTLKNEEVEALI